MAYTKLWPIKGNLSSSGMVVSRVINYDKNEEKTVKKTFSGGEISSVINYTSNADKTGERKYISTINCMEKTCIDEMLLTKQRFGEKGKRIMYHGVQSFKPGEIDKNDPELAHKLGVKLAKELWGDRFEVVVTTHLDRNHIHNHFAINSVSFIDGRKLDWDAEYKNMRVVSDRLCREHALSIIESNDCSGHVHRGEMRAEDEGRYTIESIVKEDIDTCIKCSRNLDEWYELMKEKGYRIDASGKYLKVFPYGHSKCIRVDRRFLAKYGLDYSLYGIAQMIADNIDNGKYVEPVDDAFTIPEEILNVGYIIEKTIDETDDYDDLWPYEKQPFSEYGFKLPKRVGGIQRVYNRYLILLGVHPARSVRRNARTHYLLREDLLKLDRLIGENNLLISRNITDMKTLNYEKEFEVKKLDAMNAERNKLRNKIRRSDEVTRPELLKKLANMNQEIKRQRKTVFYLKDVEKRLPVLERKLEYSEQVYKEHNKDKREFYVRRNTI